MISGLSNLSVVNQVSSECDSLIYAAAADIEKKYTTRLLPRVEAFFRAFHDDLQTFGNNVHDLVKAILID